MFAMRMSAVTLAAFLVLDVLLLSLPGKAFAPRQHCQTSKTIGSISKHPRRQRPGYLQQPTGSEWPWSKSPPAVSFTCIKANIDDSDDGQGNNDPTFDANEDKATDVSGSQNGLTLFQRLDRFGQSLKPKAQKASVKLALVPEGERAAKFKYLLQVCGLYTLFITYRAYRGFFVILPAVFKEVYRKLETAVDAPFVEDDSTEAGPNGSTMSVADTTGESKPTTGRIRWRTRITVSVLACIVTCSYVLSGALRVIMKFIKSLTQNPTDVSGSFEAAAQQQERNEQKILGITKKSPKEELADRDSSSTTKKADSDLAP